MIFSSFSLLPTLFFPFLLIRAAVLMLSWVISTLKVCTIWLKSSVMFKYWQVCLQYCLNFYAIVPLDYWCFEFKWSRSRLWWTLLGHDCTVLPIPPSWQPNLYKIFVQIWANFVQISSKFVQNFSGTWSAQNIIMYKFGQTLYNSWTFKGVFTDPSILFSQIKIFKTCQLILILHWWAVHIVGIAILYCNI